ncbi:MAG: anthranilate phosphoribosyltransferase [Candidatus Berkiella sp.]
MNESTLPFMLEQVCQGQHLSEAQAYGQFNLFMQGKLSAIEMSALLTALKAKGESPSEIMGALKLLRENSFTFKHQDTIKQNMNLVDCVGTGGDGQQSLNISTACAFVLAALDVKVAKHGNRSVSSKCGSADLFEKLGVNLEMKPECALKALQDIGLCFLYSPLYHPSMNQIRQVRSTLKVKTLFNLLGPLLNPLQPQTMLVGVYDHKYCEILVKVLQQTGVQRALVIHGEGLDEIAIHGKTLGYYLKENEIVPFELSPTMAGLPYYPLDEIKGKDIAYNTQACLDLLQGKGSIAYRASVAINAGAILWLQDKVTCIKQGVEMAQSVMSTNRAFEKLNLLKELSHAK